MSNSKNQTVEETIDLKELFFSLIVQWKLIILCVFLSIFCAVLYLRVTPSTYSADALVQVEDAKGGASAALLGQQLSSIMADSGLGGMQIAQAEIEILKSRLVLGTAIQDLNLDVQIKPTKDSIWTRIINPVHFKTDYNSQGIQIQSDGFNFDIQKFVIPNEYLDKPLLLNFEGHRFTITDKKTDVVIYKGQVNRPNLTGGWKISIFTKNPDNQQFIVVKNAQQTAVNNFLDDFTAAERGKQTGVIGLNYQGTDQNQITKVLNVILNVYKQQNVERSSAEKEQTLQFLQKQLPELKEKLDESERQFNKFREQYNTVDVTQESELYLKQSIELETQKIQLEQKQAELSAQYTEQHPMMLEINAQLGAINKKIGDLNATLKRLPDVQRQYLQYYRDVEVKNQLYTNLLNTYQTMSVAKAGEIGNVRIVDYAVEPIKPIKPKKLIVLLLSIFVGGFIGVLIALLRNMLQSGIKDASQIEDEFNVPVYATVPRSELPFRRTHLLKKKRQIPILADHNSDDVTIESLRSLRTAIYFALGKEKGNKVIMISGSSPEIGKSFIAVNFATILAQSNKRILLIDGDMRRGYLQQYFAHLNSTGLSELLSDKASLGTSIQKTNIDNLSFMARGKAPKNPAELLNTGKFAAILEQLKQEYDHIVIDTPPVLAVTDAVIISQSVDINLLVVRFAKSHVKEIEMTLNRFKQSGSHIDGTILNDIHRTSGSYGYGYDYQYSYDYKSTKK